MIPAIDDTRRRGPRERPWTPEHDRILLQLRSAGLTLPIIGERLGRTPDACSSRAIRLTTGERALTEAPDYLGDKIEAYIHRLAGYNNCAPVEIKGAFGWR